MPTAGKISAWSTTAGSNNSASPNGFPEGMAPSGVNDSARQVMAAVREWYETPQWVELHTATYASATTFTVASTDVTAVYADKRRIRAGIGSGTLYGHVVSSSYTTNTTVTVAIDGGTAMDASLSAVAVAILTVSNNAIPEDHWDFALSDEVTTITTGTAKLSWYTPYAITLTSIPYAWLTTASSSGTPTINIKEAGGGILSTKITIDANELTSGTAATPAVLSDTSLAANALITFDIDVAGTGATGLKVRLFGRRT